MSHKNSHNLRKMIFFVFVLFTVGILASCGQEKTLENRESEISENSLETDNTLQGSVSRMETPLPQENSESNPEQTDTTQTDTTQTDTMQTDTMQNMFGEYCIVEQTFEVELSEYPGKVYFVPFAPSENDQDFHMQIIQDDKVLTDIYAYVPGELAEERFSSLDAVSFYDVNYDGNTDIVLIETYGNTRFAAIYYGFDADASDYEKRFTLQEQLSENLSAQVKPLSIPEIRNFLSNGKKNGKFTSYQEAYHSISRLCELESTGEETYNLIYFDDDNIPELVAGVDGYYASLYTYHDGNIYTLMNRWSYGAGGNTGYEYSPRKNSMRNYNSDYAGAILYTTYMSVSEHHTMDTVTKIKTYNFDDVNGNRIPDENEKASIGYYGISYINGVEVTPEEWDAFEVGEYEYIRAAMSLEVLQSKLNEGVN